MIVGINRLGYGILASANTYRWRQLGIVADGDSITHGGPVTPYYPDLAPAELPANYGTITNLGIGGQFMSAPGCISGEAANVYPLIASAHAAGQLSVVSCFAGYDDIGSSVSGSTVISATTSYFQNAKTNGADICIGWTILPGVGDQSQVTLVNNFMRSSYKSIGCDYLCDVGFGGDPSMGNASSPSNSTLFFGIHPATTGNGILADYWAAILTNIGSVASVTAISPSSAPTANTTNVTITGKRLTGATVVVVGGLRATNVVVVNDTTITCTTSAGYFAGTGPVWVIGPNGSGILQNAWTWT